MARSQFARCRGRPKPAGRLPGRPARAIAAAAAGLTAAVLPALAGPARAEPIGQAEPAGRTQAASAPVTSVITSMTPSYAAPGRTITIAVQVRNVSGAALRGLSVQLLSSSLAFTSRGDLESFAQNPASRSLTALPLAPATIRRLGAGASWSPTVRVPVSALGLSCFGVYPMAARISDSAGPLASDPMLLPYWPGRVGSCQPQRPKPSDIAWIWPLIDRPHQGACPGLVDNSLAASVQPAGRLGELLAIGRKYAGSAQLTWVVDPALLDNVRTMKQPYLVGGSPGCTGQRALARSPAAAAWLASLSAATAGRPVVATPYADVDVAALTQHARNLDASLAFSEGQRVAGQILNRTFASGTHLAGSRQLAAIAWPADGIANYPLLESLAANKIGTVILDSSTMPVPGVNYTPGAVASTPDGVYGTQMRVLLADHTITQLLGSRAAGSRDPGTSFGVRQLFLAETAMIVAERPRDPRAIVVAPPRHWKPNGKLASRLLADTVSAPWLRPSTAAQLLALPSDHLARPQPQSVSPSELPRRLLRDVASLDRKIALLESVRVPGDPDLLLYRAAFGIESSAWRGGRAAERPAKAMLRSTARFIAAQWKDLSVGSFRDVTLGGTVSTVRVHVSNKLSYPVRVRLVLTASNRSVKASVLNTYKGIITVKAGVTSTVKLAVTATTGGAGTIRLSLRSPAGRPLPVRPVAMHVRATQFGTVALVICAAALAVFVFASAARAIRLGRTGPPEPAGDHAGSPDAGPADQADGAEKPDNVEPDQSELTPAGPGFADQGPPVPGRRRTGGRR